MAGREERDRRRKVFRAIDTSPIISVKAMEVVEIKAFWGKGTDEEPTQVVTYYFDRDGKWLATASPPIKIEDQPQ